MVLRKLGTDCMTFYETISSLLKTIGNSLEKKSYQSGTGHSSIQNCFILNNWEPQVSNKIKEPHNTGLSPMHNSNMGFNPKCMILRSYAPSHMIPQFSL
jgi:hypothetical protein